MLDVRASHVAAIARGGLVAELPDATAVGAAVEAATDPSGLAPAEVALVATKAFATEAAARGAGPLIGPGTWIATVQNGLGNDRALARAVGAARVVPGSTTVAAEAAGDGRVRIGESVLAGRSSTVFGPPRGVVGIPPALESFAAALTEAGLPAHVDPDVDLVIWRKLVLAGSMGPLSAALGLTVAGTMANPPAVALLRRLVAEIAAVATACGAALDPDEAWGALPVDLRRPGRAPGLDGRRPGRGPAHGDRRDVRRGRPPRPRARRRDAGQRRRRRARARARGNRRGRGRARPDAAASA